MRKRTLLIVGFLLILIGFALTAYLTKPDDSDDFADSTWFGPLETQARRISNQLFGWPPPRPPRFFVVMLEDINFEVIALLAERVERPGKTQLGIQEARFTLNGQPTFLLGMSYYAALGAPNDIRDRDLAELKRQGYNWIRMWANWAAFENDISAVDVEGQPREEYLGRLKDLVATCDKLGMIVDVSLSRGNGITGPPRLQSLEAHQKAVETLVNALKPYKNWYLDLSNERNIKDKRHTSFADLKALRERVRQLDPERLVTASHAGDISEADVKEYLTTVGVDFLSPHRPRQSGSPKATAEKTHTYLAWMKSAGKTVPVHYQEPFRRGFGKWQPSAEDYKVDLQGAIDGGAAGWCFHNGDQRDKKDGMPRRSFDLRQMSLFEQFDEEEKSALRAIESIKR